MARCEADVMERRMAPSSRLGRIAWSGVVLTILAIGLGIALGAASIRHSTKVVAASTALAGAYTDADETMSAMMALERQYRLDPGPVLRDRYAEQRTTLETAFAAIEHRGAATDRALVYKLRVSFRYYDQAVLRMFDAVDAGNLSLTRSIETYEVGPAYDEIDAMIDAAADEHAASTEAALVDLARIETVIHIANWIGFGIGMILVTSVALLMRRHQRELVRHAEESKRQATHDGLTGLPNRFLFTDRLGQELAAGRRTGAEVAVMLLDVDRFKEVNDTLGPRYGDELLRGVATRLSGLLREQDTVARLSGDEFAVLLRDAGPDAGRALADRVLQRMHESFALGEVTVDIEVSVGLAMPSGQAATAEDVMRCADLALYHAKNDKTGVAIYEPTMVVNQPAGLPLLGDLRRALDRADELVLHYQPKIGLASGDVCGMEALVRWKHPTRGLVPPAEFIPIAENTGIINRLTIHVLSLALAQARIWLDEGNEFPVAVNLSPRCLLDLTMLDRIRRLLTEHRVPARMLRLEVTETAVMTNPALAMKTLKDLHQLGVRLSIDDYGTGYSSMAYLSRLPVDELKIDRSFVSNMADSGNDAVLVSSAVDLGHNLGLTVVAEGVENADQVMALRDMGCDIGQGYHFARPMPPDQLAEWLRSTERATATPRLPDVVRPAVAP